ncbi:hypothetical protein [Kytococcus sedentarius]|uniref:hypothetical protein n=1 Tax=Kytococcus sedentarius TaxID=1276 RepID=UPI0035BC0338
MSHATGGPSGPYAYHPQQQPKRKGLMPLIFGGLTLIVGTPLAFLLPMAIGMGDLFGALLNPASDGDTRYLPADQERVLYAMGPDADPLETDQCTVTDPAGNAVTLEPQLTENASAPQNFWLFHTTEAGDYTLECGPGSVMAVAPGDALEGVIGWTLGAFALALIAFLLGLGLIIWGIAQLVRTGRDNQAAAGGHGPPPGAAPYGYAGQHGQPGQQPGPYAPPGPQPGPYGQQPPAQPQQPGQPGQPGADAGHDPRAPHPLNGAQGRPAPEYGQYAPGHEPDAQPGPDAQPQPGPGPDGDGPGGAHRL